MVSTGTIQPPAFAGLSWKKFLKQWSKGYQSIVLISTLEGLWPSWSFKVDKEMKQGGYQGQLLRFMASFLEVQEQKVYANGLLSGPLPIASGTQQGAPLSPLYFAMFIASIRECIKEYIKEEEKKGKEKRTREEEGLWLLLFADDTKASGIREDNAGM